MTDPREQLLALRESLRKIRGLANFILDQGGWPSPATEALKAIRHEVTKTLGANLEVKP